MIVADPKGKLGQIERQLFEDRLAEYAVVYGRHIWSPDDHPEKLAAYRGMLRCFTQLHREVAPWQIPELFERFLVTRKR